MKPTVVSAGVLFEDHRDTLKWQWIAGLGASERRFDEVAIRAARSGADLVGYLNYIHPYRLQVIGEREVAYLTSPSVEDNRRRVARIVTLEPPVLVVADDQPAPDELLAMCERAQIPMFSTRESAAFVIDVAHRAGLDVVQLHGCTSVSDVHAVRASFAGEVWSVVRIGPEGLRGEQRPLATAAHGVVLDTLSRRGLGGTGESFDWEGVTAAVGEIRERTRVILAGGLRAENVDRAIRVLSPDVVDVSSGVEAAPGVKDHGRMRAFVDAVRQADRG